MDGGKTRISLRLNAGGLLMAALAVVGCGHVHPTAAAQKLIVLGIDGMDPGFVERHWDVLPNLDCLRREGGFRRLGTTIPPQSPVAWSTFITGLDPGGHGIFDFVHRDPATLAPFSSMGEVAEPRHMLPLGPYQLPLSSGEVRFFRQGKAFWQILAEHGIPATILRMPVNFPPVHCACEELSGMGTPDMQGTFGTFTFYTDDPAWQPGELPGGRIVSVSLTGNDAVLPIGGPANSLRKDHRPTSVPLHVHIDGTTARFDLDGASFILRQGEWSDWNRVRFPLIPLLKSAAGMVRIYARSYSPLAIYVSPVNIDPAAPALPISSPASYSRDLARAIGPYYTQGIAEDTAALRDGVFSLEEFEAQSRVVTEEQIAMLHHGLEHFDGGVFFEHFSGVDQNSHMLWAKHEPELLETYRRMDDAIGWVRRREPGATLIVMSDHGFTAFDRAVHLNTWLMKQGYLALDDPADTGPDDLFAHVDWSRTKAYALGLNGLYLNLRGRERRGIVAPGAPAERLIEEISRRLLEFRDPASGGQPVSDVYVPRQVFHGKALAFAPDLIVGYSPGYRCSWQSALGAVPPELIEDNRDAWIGDHCIAARYVPGVLLSNRPIRLPDPQLADVTVTILSAFGIRRPSGLEGRLVF